MPTLLLMRHGIAELRGPAWPDDEVRPLTKKGQARVREIGGRLRTIGETAERILSSPLTRAIETARIMADQWPSAHVTALEALAPGHTPQQAIVALAARVADGRVLLVGHEPDLGALAAWVIGATHPLPFKKGGVARIDLKSWARPRDGQLVWLATPRMLRRSD